MTKLIENLKASIFVSTLTKNLSMYSRFDAPRFRCVNGCMLFILYYRVNRIGGNRSFEILTNPIFFMKNKKASKVSITLLV
ncbi:TPA: hypothetical protein PSJ20_001447 [Staphylococcus aureus]|uniref:hypothetical protein n=1 Tax=Staphylococcus aureus TaxID=1280 RepID=UPI0005C269C0|nr:hypothetical protein [Staphylococcus aureus]HDH6406673.1 hypothetical protein [Staphylococcus aureus MRSA-Lux-40]AJP23442.1 hypothetical protein UC16_11910 [Staphylococcus aureus]ATZ15094.1 hypothetical protein CU118_09420 [Staphylococcus aureus]EJX2102802.1 hypothetical protein [Staphylococcus aureus]EKF1404375.1 hypothetical protein [Staphylococcus aureus]